MIRQPQNHRHQNKPAVARSQLHGDGFPYANRLRRDLILQHETAGEKQRRRRPRAENIQPFAPIDFFIASATAVFVHFCLAKNSNRYEFRNMDN
jgi:hypothetical protein